MTLEQTETWFLQEYGDRKEELSFRCLFAESMDKEADGVCMAWTEAGTDGSLIPSLHWLAVRDAKKGQGIGTALVREALRVFAGRGEVPVFLHTQPWSYEAVGLYLKAGFFLCRSETFGTHKNQFQEGIRILEQYLEVDPRPVSYTHLDVYKRQGLGGSAWTVNDPEIIRSLMEKGIANITTRSLKTAVAVRKEMEG